ncbi:uncharacterized protein LOC124533036 [Vanessa cardui]|uniref:uncharacterized protein LOC124533036 n=1 Tax=Vanessa cardui TaxID=171605 RepID=UPI001F12AF3C|nr:uncharacterized protein LOC124533036 [Vanessa cardui]
MIFVVILMFLILPLLVTLDFVYYIIFNFTQVRTLIYRASFYATLLILLLLETLFVFINNEVLVVFQAMCRKLQQFEALIRTGFIPDLRVVNESIRSLSHSYVSGCDVVNRINKKDGMIIVLLFSMSGVSIFIIGFNLFSATRHIYMPNKSFFCMKEVAWITLYIIKAAVFVEPGHLIAKEVQNMQALLSHLMVHTTPVGKPVSIEMDVLYKETILNKPTFAPLGLLTIDRSLIIVMCSYITTYLVFSIQLKSQ